MRNMLKRIMAVLLAVVMVITGLPAMGLAPIADVQADEETFNPDLDWWQGMRLRDYGSVDQSKTYWDNTQVKNYAIWWVIGNGSNLYTNLSSGSPLAYGHIYFQSGKTGYNYVKEYWYDGTPSWIVDLKGAIDEQLASQGKDFTLVQALSSADDGLKRELYYGLFTQEDGGQFVGGDAVHPDSPEVRGYVAETGETNGRVFGCETNRARDLTSHSAGMHAEAGNQDNVPMHKVQSTTEGGMVVPRDLFVELHFIDNSGHRGLYASYYTNPAPGPKLFGNTPDWVWYDEDADGNNQATDADGKAEYLRRATATFVAAAKPEKNSVSRPATITGELLSDSKVRLNAVANFADYDAFEERLKDKTDDADGKVGNVYATKDFTVSWPTWTNGLWQQDATVHGATAVAPKTAKATYTLDTYTPDEHVKNDTDPQAAPDATVDSYTRNAAVTAAYYDEGATEFTAKGARLTATSDDFYSLAPTSTRDFAVTWSQTGNNEWTATFTNGNDTYTRTATPSVEGDKLVARVYFCDLPFAKDCGPASTEYRIGSLTWYEYGTKNASNEVDNFYAVAMPQKKVGNGPWTNLFEQPVTVNPGTPEYRPVKNDSTQKLTVDVTVKFTDPDTHEDKELKSEDFGYTLKFDAPAWDWDGASYSGNFMTAHASFALSSDNNADAIANLHSPYSITAYQVTHDQPTRRADGNYDWKHYATAKFCENDFQTNKTEVVEPEVTIRTTKDGSGNVTEDWTWDPYNKETGIIAAHATFVEYITRWDEYYSAEHVLGEVVRQELHTEQVDATNTDNADDPDTYLNDTSSQQDVLGYTTGELPVGGKVRFQAKAEYRGVTVTSKIREFECTPTKNSATFVVNEVGTDLNLNETITLTAQGEAAQNELPVYDNGNDVFNKAIFKDVLAFNPVTQNYEAHDRAMVPFSRVYYTNSILRSQNTSMDTEWVWSNYNGENAADGKYYTAHYYVVSNSSGTREVLAEGDGIVTYTKTSTGITLTASANGDGQDATVNGLTVKAEQKTVSRSDWTWVTTDASKGYSDVKLTFNQAWDAVKTPPTDGSKAYPFTFQNPADYKGNQLKVTLTKGNPTLNENTGKYQVAYNATVTFCGLDYTDQKTVDITPVITPIVVVTPTVTPTVTPSVGPPITPTGIPEISVTPRPGYDYDEMTEDKWYWNDYKWEPQEIPARVTIGDLVSTWSLEDPTKVETTTMNPRTYYDDETALAQNAAGDKSGGRAKDGSGEKRVYFQGVAEDTFHKNAPKTFKSDERRFNFTKSEWNGKTDCTFTFTEVDGLNEVVTLKVSDLQAKQLGGFELDNFRADPNHLGKLMADKWAYVYFGHQKFYSETPVVEDDITPDSYGNIVFTWSSYDRTNDRYTATYTMDATITNDGTTYTVKLGKAFDADGNVTTPFGPVVATAEKLANNKGVKLTVSIENDADFKPNLKKVSGNWTLFGAPINGAISDTRNVDGLTWQWGGVDYDKDQEKFMSVKASLRQQTPFENGWVDAFIDFDSKNADHRITLTHVEPPTFVSDKTAKDRYGRYDYFHNAEITFCGQKFSSDEMNSKLIPTVTVTTTPTPPPPGTPTPTTPPELKDKRISKDKWYWSTYDKASQEFEADANVVDIITTANGEQTMRPRVLPDPRTSEHHASESYGIERNATSGKGLVRFQGVVVANEYYVNETDAEPTQQTLESAIRDFECTDNNGWDAANNNTDCEFTFTEKTAYLPEDAPEKEVYKLKVSEMKTLTDDKGNALGGIVNIGDVEAVGDGTYRQKVQAFVYFGHQIFWSKTAYQKVNTDDFVAKWEWLEYSDANDCYQVKYQIYSRRGTELTEIAGANGTLNVTHGSNKSPLCDAVKQDDKTTKLVASVKVTLPDAGEKTFDAEPRYVAAPDWSKSPKLTWENRNSKTATATFSEAGTANPVANGGDGWKVWTKFDHDKTDSKASIAVTEENLQYNGDEAKWSLQYYALTRSAKVTFCGNLFSMDDYDNDSNFKYEKIPPTFTNRDNVTWDWYEYDPELNGTPDANGKYLGNFKKVKATIKDDQNGSFERYRYADGTNRTAGADESISIAVSGNNTEDPNPSRITFTALVKAKEGANTMDLSDALTFGLPVWSWNDAAAPATANFDLKDVDANTQQKFRVQGTPENNPTYTTKVSLTDSSPENVRTERTDGNMEKYVFLAKVYFGEHLYDQEKDKEVNTTYQDTWTWKQYKPEEDMYTAAYEITSVETGTVIKEGIVNVRHGTGASDGCDAEKTASGQTKLTAKVTVKIGRKDWVFSDTQTVDAPDWSETAALTWDNYEKSKAGNVDINTAKAKFTELGKIAGKWSHWTPNYNIRSVAADIEMQVVNGKSTFEFTDGTKQYYLLTREAEVTFCGNKFNLADEDDQSRSTVIIPPSFNELKVTWVWDDYAKDLNGTDKGNFEKATATLKDDLGEYFYLTYECPGTNTTAGSDKSISISTTGPNVNPTTTTFTALAFHQTDSGRVSLTDELHFPGADWTWNGTASATAKFELTSADLADGKFFGNNKTSVELTDTQIESEAFLEYTIFKANVFFGEHEHTNEKQVNSKYVVYLRLPSKGWPTNASDIYIRVLDDNGKQVDVPKPMKAVKKNSAGDYCTRFFNYTLLEEDIKGVTVPTVEFCKLTNGNYTRLDTGSNPLKMEQEGDYIYYEASKETSSGSKNNWEIYDIGVNGHSLTLDQTGVFGLNCLLELPERYNSVSATMKTELVSGTQSFTTLQEKRRDDGKVVINCDVRVYRFANKVETTISFINKKNQQDSKTDRYSIVDYIDAMLARINAGDTTLPASFETMLKMLYNYGYYSQLGLNYIQSYVTMPRGAYTSMFNDNRATVTANTKRYEIQLTGFGDYEVLKSMLLTLHADANLSFSIFPKDKQRMNSFNAVLTGANANNYTVKIAENSASSYPNGKKVTMYGISALNLASKYTFNVSIKTSDGKDVNGKVVVSPLSWVYATLNSNMAEKSKDLANSIFEFYYAFLTYMRTLNS